MWNRIFCLFISALILYSCEDKRPIDECSLEITFETRDWLPYRKGDTVSIMVNSIPVQFIVTENDYSNHIATQGTGYPFSSLCINEWNVHLQSTDMKIFAELNMSDDFRETTMSIAGKHAAFVGYKPESNQKIAVFVSDSLRATIEYEKGFVEIVPN